MSRSGDAKTAVMAGALVVTGICEFLEGVEKGVDVLTSASEAVRKTKARGQAIKKAGREVARKERAARKKRRMEDES